MTLSHDSDFFSQNCVYINFINSDFVRKDLLEKSQDCETYKLRFVRKVWIVSFLFYFFVVETGFRRRVSKRWQNFYFGCTVSLMFCVAKFDIFHSVPHMASLCLINQELETGVLETFGIHSFNISVSYTHTHASLLTNTVEASRCQNRLGASAGPFITLLWCSCLLY